MNDNQNTHCYEAMFLLDNQEVRRGFNAVRDQVKATLEKHGITVRVLRLWSERALVYPIKRHKRATYVLGWLEATGEAVNAAKRDFYLVGPVLRCLFLGREAIPEEELAYGIQEVDEATLVIPEDDAAETGPEAPEEAAPETETPEPAAAEEGPAAEATAPEADVVPVAAPAAAEAPEEPPAEEAGEEDKEVQS